MNLQKVVVSTLIAIVPAIIQPAFADQDDWEPRERHAEEHQAQAQLGPRPFFLVNDMDEGQLKSALQQCSTGPFYKTDFSIGHRGASLQFPEHTKESYEAAARMGAGIVECDVTFTKDRELVCRHSQCDLHQTTNILATPLAPKCSVPFNPADIDPVTGQTLAPATAKCCTSDITLAEFKSLKGKMDGTNPNATTVEEYLKGTPDWRTDLYDGPGTVMSHKDSIALFKKLGVKFTPELKSPSVMMPFQGTYTQQDYAQQLIDEYRQAGVAPDKVFAQSFNLADIEYWIMTDPQFGAQGVYLDGRYDDPSFDVTDPATWSPSMDELAAKGVRYLSPPMWMLLSLDDAGKVVPSIYAEKARAAGLKIIAWTFERSDLRNGAIRNGVPEWYYQTIGEAVKKDGDKYMVLDVLAKQVGIVGIFSDWPATVSYYANCMNLR